MLSSLLSSSSPLGLLLRSFSSSSGGGNICRRAERGLYAGKTVRFGYRRSDFGNKSRRAWRPNVHRVRLYSETLDERISIRTSSTALRLVDRAGGLDNYLLAQKQPESRRADQLVRQILLKRHQDELSSSQASSLSSTSTSSNTGSHGLFEAA